LSKTKTQTAQAIVLLNSLGFFLMLHAPPTGTKGGLLLAWRHGVDLECFSITVNIINVWCYFDPSNNPWLLTCIYGPPKKKEKKKEKRKKKKKNRHRPCFWDSLLDKGKDYNEPMYW
jgi:hypothetical protein